MRRRFPSENSRMLTMLKFALALVGALALTTAAHAQSGFLGTPIKIHVGVSYCQFQVVRPSDALPIWYGVNLDSQPHLLQCELVREAVDDHAAIGFSVTGGQVPCSVPVCGADSIIGVQDIFRDPSVLVITLVVGGPSVYVTVLDQDGMSVPQAITAGAQLVAAHQ
jgi:hypothetical protein